jgi:hypothetical protein
MRFVTPCFDPNEGSDFYRKPDYNSMKAHGGMLTMVAPKRPTKIRVPEDTLSCHRIATSGITTSLALSAKVNSSWHVPKLSRLQASVLVVDVPC